MVVDVTLSDRLRALRSDSGSRTEKLRWVRGHRRRKAKNDRRTNEDSETRRWKGYVGQKKVVLVGEDCSRRGTMARQLRPFHLPHRWKRTVCLRY